MPAAASPRAADVLLTIAVALGITAMLALAGSRFHVVPLAGGGTWRGVSDPPSAARWAVSAAVGLAAALALSRRSPRLRKPLAALLLAAAPLVPVMTGRAIPLLALQGPVLLLVEGAVLGIVLARLVARGEPGPVPALLLFAAPFVFNVALASRIPGGAGFQGDEPHYLVIAQSLLTDRDLDLADEFASREYNAFFPGRLDPHPSPSTPADRLYSLHAPGLPLVILPAFALGGAFGAQVMMSAIAALAGLLVHRVARTAAGERAAALAWTLFSFTPPVPVYAVSIYPELPAALATAIFLRLSQGEPRWRGALAAALVAGATPWLHSKFLPLGVCGLAFVLLRPMRWRARAGALAVFMAMVGGLLVLYRRLYGQATLSAAFGTPDVDLTRIPWGAAGMLLDRQFGLIAFSAVWLLAAPGLVLLARRRFGDAIRVAALGAVPLVVGGAFVMWWGGSSPPARFLLPAVPAFALALAPAALVRKDAAAALGGIGLTLLGIAADAPRILHTRLDGESPLLRNLNPSLDLNGWFPSFLTAEPGASLLGISMLGAAALAWRWGIRGLLLGVAAYAAVVSGVRTRPLVDARLAAEDVLDAWDGDNWAGPAGPPDLRALPLGLELQKGPWLLGPGDERNSRRMTLYPGDYLVEVRGRVLEAPLEVDVALTAGELVLAQGRLTEAQPVVVWPLLLPVGARQIGLRVAGRAGRAELEGAALVPRALARRSRRGDLAWPTFALTDRYRVGDRSVRVTAVDRSSPEDGGFRLPGGEGAFVIDGPAAATAEIIVRRARPRARDAVEWNGREVVLSSSPEVRLTLPLSEGIDLGRATLVPVRVRAEAGTWVRFRSTDVP